MLRASKVLVASDLSDSADEAIRQADAWARASGGELVAVHVLPEGLRYHPLFPQRAADDLAAMVAADGQMGDALADRVAAVTGRARDDFRVAVAHGPAASGIVAEAEAQGADLVVVGSRGIAGLERFLLGSVAERVVRYAHCPVLVARSSPEAGPVLTATDFSDPSIEAIAAGTTAARWLGAPLALFHAVDVVPPAVVGLAMPLGATWVPIPAEDVAQIHEGAKKMLEDSLARAGVPGTVSVVEGRPASSLVDEARKGARLVVLGTRGRTGLSRLTLGSTAETVVKDAPCSVLVVRAPATT